MSGTTGWASGGSKARPGRGSSDLISAIISARSAASTPHNANQRGNVAGREQRQVVEQGLHRRIEPVAVAQLQREAFRQVASEDAGRVELLQPSENGLDPVDLAAEELRHAVEPGAQVARLVEQIEKMQRDDPVARDR